MRYRDALSANSNGAFRINQLIFRPLDPAQPDVDGPIETLVLTITQDPTEYLEVLVDCGGVNQSHATNYWLGSFGHLHPAVRAPAFNGAELVPDTAPVIALATYSRQVPAGGSPTAVLSENTLVEVISKPGQLEPLPNPFETSNASG